MDHLQRILIFGNGGTGKTWLAREISGILNYPAIHLNDLRWAPGQYGFARDKKLVFNEVDEAGKADQDITWRTKPNRISNQSWHCDVQSVQVIIRTPQSAHSASDRPGKRGDRHER
ncbi:hypothetical protein [Ochrobactrum sp. MYb379]|uniref:hypothetical protein n=1 Tax=Ochrobactrum sp. MYb379 TaxID=2745275 RepID=UPI003096830B